MLRERGCRDASIGCCLLQNLQHAHDKPRQMGEKEESHNNRTGFVEQGSSKLFNNEGWLDDPTRLELQRCKYRIS